MRITKEFADRLSDKLCHTAIKIERAALNERRQALSKAVLNLLYPEGQAFYEALPDHWVHYGKSARFHFRQNERYAELHLTFETEIPLPGVYAGSVGLKVTDEALMDEIVGVDAAERDIYHRSYNLKNELHANIVRARTVKNLMALWPEAAEEIAAMAAQYGPNDVEIPLESILRRYSGTMLPAPVVEVAV